MVERVARGRIMVPAVAAVGALSAGLLASGAVQAGARDATLQMRVQVVDTCRIRLAPGGLLDQACGSGGHALPRVTISDLVDGFGARGTARFRASEPPVRPPKATMPVLRAIDPPARSLTANQRAGGVALQIAQRVRLITLIY